METSISVCLERLLTPTTNNELMEN
jgi:hypothetical protein